MWVFEKIFVCKYRIEKLDRGEKFWARVHVQFLKFSIFEVRVFLHFFENPQIKNLKNIRVMHARALAKNFTDLISFSQSSKFDKFSKLFCWVGISTKIYLYQWKSRNEKFAKTFVPAPVSHLINSALKIHLIDEISFSVFFFFQK